MSADNSDTVTRIHPVKSRGGEWVRIGDEEYKIPPLAFETLQELPERLEPLRAMAPGAAPNKAQMEAIVGLIHTAMRRNYPEITAEDVRGMLDLGNYQAIFSAVMRVAGLRKEAAKPDAPGETVAAVGAQSTQH